MNLPFFFRRPRPLTASDVGRMGGQARARKVRQLYRDRARQLLAEMGKADDPRIPA